MNLIDLVIIAALIGTGIGGWRLGLVARAFAWAGVITGLAIGVNFVPRVVTGLGGTTPDSRVGVALLFLFLVGSIGQAFGLVLGLLVHRVFPISNPLPLWDRDRGRGDGYGWAARADLVDHPVVRRGRGLARAGDPQLQGRRRHRRRRAPPTRELRGLGAGDLGGAVPVGPGSAGDAAGPGKRHRPPS